jgi:hypothetical protein
LVELKSINLAHTNLTGTLPDLSALENLVNLDVQGLLVTGSVPDAVIYQLETFLTNGSFISSDPLLPPVDVEITEAQTSASLPSASASSTALLALVLYAMLF